MKLSKRAKSILSVLLLLLLALGGLWGKDALSESAAPDETISQASQTAQPEDAAAALDEDAAAEETLTEAPAPAEEPSDTDNTAPAEEPAGEQPAESTAAPLAEDGSYDSKEEVCQYLLTYGHLPGNYITKKQAEALGWKGGGLEDYAPGKCIGGSRFGNYEGLLPEAEGRSYTECDIDTLYADSRGSKRIVFSNDGLIYYTADHYETFELLAGTP